MYIYIYIYLSVNIYIKRYRGADMSELRVCIYVYRETHIHTLTHIRRDIGALT
jgi:hypothetical protein